VSASDLKTLWPGYQLPEGLARSILRDNPWWEGAPSRVLPPRRRRFVDEIHRSLERKLAPITVVRGPRQVGKTTAQLQVINDLLGRGVPPINVLRVQFDDLAGLGKLADPILRIVDWYEHTVLQRTLNEVAHAGARTFLFFDEVQNLRDWAPQLKHLVDHATTQVVVTGSSALRIAVGHDSLAGRIRTLEVGTLTLSEVASIRFEQTLPVALPINGIDRIGQQSTWLELRALANAHRELRDLAFDAFAERGGYPLVHERPDQPWEEIAAQLNENVIKRVIVHDLRLGDRGRRRDKTLLEELFRLGCRYAGQAPSVAILARELQRALNANVGPQKIRKYLEFLDLALLLRLVDPLELRLKRTHGAPKLCLADHGLRASWLQEPIALTPEALARRPEDSDLAGRIAESIVGTFLITSIGGDQIKHFPERSGEPEVDFVIVSGSVRIPVEVKYRRRINALEDTAGLRSFIERSTYRAPFGILVTQNDEPTVTDPRIVELSLSSLLMLR